MKITITSRHVFFVLINNGNCEKIVSIAQASKVRQSAKDKKINLTNQANNFFAVMTKLTGIIWHFNSHRAHVINILQCCQIRQFVAKLATFLVLAAIEIWLLLGLLLRR